MGSGKLFIGLMPIIGLKAVEIGCLGGKLAAKWAVGKGASDGVSVDVYFGGDALYSSYSRSEKVSSQV